MPSRTASCTQAIGPGAPSTPTRQTRHAPNGACRSSKQSVGMSAPATRTASRTVVAVDDLDARCRRSSSLGIMRRPSSSGKCSIRLRIGAGMPPPCAQRLPASSVSSSASRRSRRPARWPFTNISCAAAQADAAREALAAALRRAEVQQVLGDAAHVGLVVERDDPAVADHAALGGERLEVEARVELRSRAGCPPSGPPICSALIVRPSTRPPATSSHSSRSVIPNGTS